MEAKVGKKYRHYKNGRGYTVLAIGRLESNPDEECVVYRAEYDSEDFGKHAVWIRPRVAFEELIEVEGVEGKLVPRFTEVE